VKNRDISGGRLARAFFISPLIGCLFVGSYASFKTGDHNALETSLITLLLGAPVAYGFMLIVGFPAIIILERLRLSKKITFSSYLIVSTIFVIWLLVSKGYDPVLPLLLVGSLGAGLASAFFMLFKRDDW
tara:strand:- start:334 stop:723 length:390 start_codon:yes stop_codon:yes gene_type:complete